jgi:hypothetical protein
MLIRTVVHAFYEVPTDCGCSVFNSNLEVPVQSGADIKTASGTLQEAFRDSLLILPIVDGLAQELNTRLYEEASVAN